MINLLSDRGTVSKLSRKQVGLNLLWGMHDVSLCRLVKRRSCYVVAATVAWILSSTVSLTTVSSATCCERCVAAASRRTQAAWRESAGGDRCMSSMAVLAARRLSPLPASGPHNFTALTCEWNQPETPLKNKTRPRVARALALSS